MASNTVTVVIKLGAVTLTRVTTMNITPGPGEARVFEVQLDPETLTQQLVEPLAAELMRQLRERWAGR